MVCALALRDDASDEALDAAQMRCSPRGRRRSILRWALTRMRDAVRNRPRDERAAAAWREAAAICDEDVETCRAHRRARARLLREAWREEKPGEGR